MDTNKLNKKNLTKWTKRTPQREPKKSSKKKNQKTQIRVNTSPSKMYAHPSRALDAYLCRMYVTTVGGY